MDSNLEAARGAITQLTARLKKYEPERIDCEAVDTITNAGLSALEAADVEIKTVRESLRNTLKALMHRMGDPG